MLDETHNENLFPTGVFRAQKIRNEFLTRYGKRERESLTQEKCSVLRYLLVLSSKKRGEREREKKKKKERHI